MEFFPFVKKKSVIPWILTMILLLYLLIFSLYSWFSIHNETVNIWTHLIGFLIFMTCFGYIIWSPPREIHSYLELAPLMVQLVSYMVILKIVTELFFHYGLWVTYSFKISFIFQICMLSSSLFHTFSCHSEAAHKSWRFTDHFSILFALFGTYISIICSIFSCFPVSVLLINREQTINKQACRH